ncbi:DUF4190 domain-containing protein [Actinomadura opuntiae]|uniref:DUF4190 domain-containing protein n=1 Tax=Actinomadura sp. OS1-43 TaxID=604315 RepID=UPI00255B1C45|nr:DUF4190 domain-containing protein [Actinomadura sp. OS1-43]MDL4818022.1 septum formation family protein [Actinomadura sp. OS1-43]
MTLIAYLPAVTTPPDADHVPETPAEAWAPPVGPPHSPGFAPPPPAPGPRRTNRLAIAALVTGFLGLVVFAIGFAIAALVQAGRRNEKGRGLAIGALAASTAWIIALATVAVVVPARHSHHGGATAAPDVRNGKPRVTTLQIGDCFDAFEEDINRIYANPVSCTGQHEGEIGAAITMPGSAYRGDAALMAEATRLCGQQTHYLMKNRFANDIEMHVDRPRRDAWEHGEHHVTCVLRYTGKEKLMGTLGSLTWGPRYYTQLVAGDCVREWSKTRLETVDCSKPHEIQVYSVYDLHGNNYPSTRAAEDGILRDCAERAVKLFGTHPLRSLMPGYGFPSKHGWTIGERRIVCTFTAAHGRLRHSVMPG